MTTVSTLHAKTLKLHHEAHDTKLMVRYREHKIALIDHYRHLCQLLPIYLALEEKILCNDFTFKIPDDLAYLREISKRILEDIAFLKKYIPKELHGGAGVLLPETNAYVAELKDLKVGDDNNKILAHFLLRVLGDLNGGMALRGYLTQIFRVKGIVRDAKDEGVCFYTFPADALAKVTGWVAAQDVKKGQEEDVMAAEMNHGYRVNINMFDALEKGCVSEEKIIIPHAKNSCNLFSPRNLFIGVSILSVAAVAVCACLGNRK